MNRNNDGTVLSDDQLIQIALDHGITEHQLGKVRALHNSNLIRSALLVMTAEARLDLMSEGKLKLGTNEDFMPKPIPGIDAEMMAWGQANKVVKYP